MSKTILCATDGTPHAEKAVGYAAELARAFEAKLVLLAVQPLNMGRGGPVPVWDADKMAKALAAGASHAKQIGVVTVETTTAKGPDVVGAILDIARDHHAEQIVVGSGSKNMVQRSLLGSVSSGIVHRADCPVTVVH